MILSHRESQLTVFHCSPTSEVGILGTVRGRDGDSDGEEGRDGDSDGEEGRDGDSDGEEGREGDSDGEEGR